MSAIESSVSMKYPPVRNYIGGEFVPGDAYPHLDVYKPADGSVISMGQPEIAVVQGAHAVVQGGVTVVQGGSRWCKAQSRWCNRRSGWCNGRSRWCKARSCWCSRAVSPGRA